MFKRLIFLISIFTFIVFTSCSDSKDRIISNFHKAGIFQDSTIYLDYEDAYSNGFVIPSIRQTTDGKFVFNFTINNSSGSESSFAYKIYYQNESYKFTELIDTSYNTLAAENFYGSYKDCSIGFKIVKVNGQKTISDSIQIVGNPRDEKKYYNKSARAQYSRLFQKLISEKANEIKNNKEWLESIKQKSILNNTSIDKQLIADAKWIVNQDVIPNNRFERNPRVGEYSFLLVVTPVENLKNIPDYIKDISKTKNDTFVNPYYFFGKQASKDNQIFVSYLNNGIKVIAKPPLNRGIYIEDKYLRSDTSYYSKYVNHSRLLQKNSAIQYHENFKQSSELIKNIPFLSNDFNDNYTLADYTKNIEKSDFNRTNIFITSPQKHGETYGYDSLNNRIWFNNPKSTPHNLHKESIGLRTRHGLSYGKYTFKLKLPKLLNKNNIWTGLTNAIWLITEDSLSWNNRRATKDSVWTKGYMPYYGAGKTEKRVKQISYSEIDFEIVKAAQYWPKTSYPDKKERPEPDSNKDKVMVTCTNWDMANREPTDFGVGVNKIKYKNNEFNIHRWDHWYNALTSKVPVKDDEIFGGDYYYFQLEWTPSEIIWRIGPEKNKLFIVGYMNDKVTNIPNNQMLCTITQEYHLSRYWPNAPFLQENIPFIGEDNVGYLYSIEIE